MIIQPQRSLISDIKNGFTRNCYFEVKQTNSRQIVRVITRQDVNSSNYRLTECHISPRVRSSRLSQIFGGLRPDLFGTTRRVEAAITQTVYYKSETLLTSFYLGWW
ncbi:hypothetical protein J6590_082919 [Homalodisca vitripennis]|nr:hypothetical protein J6590_082919 [Homalodisca vitripennis]